MATKNDPPLWMPHGSVRAIIAIMVIFVTAVGVFNDSKLPNEWWGIVGLVLGSYAKDRMTEEKEDANNSTKK